MRLNITGINFNYDNGYENEYTSVDLSFVTSGATYSLSGPVTVTKEEYQAASGNDGLKELIKNTIIADLQA